MGFPGPPHESSSFKPAEERKTRGHQQQSRCPPACVRHPGRLFGKAGCLFGMQQHRWDEHRFWDQGAKWRKQAPQGCGVWGCRAAPALPGEPQPGQGKVGEGKGCQVLCHTGDLGRCGGVPGVRTGLGRAQSRHQIFAAGGQGSREKAPSMSTLCHALGLLTVPLGT